MSELLLDDLSIYRGAPYKITDKITITQPTLNQIADMGEQKYFSAVQHICSTSSDMKWPLHQAGYDWEKIDDYQMFMMIASNITPDQTYLILGDIDLSRLSIHQRKDSDDKVLVDLESGVYIDEMVYLKIVNYLRKIHGFKRNVITTESEFSHDMLIEVERSDIEKAKNKPYKSFLLPLISSVKARQGYTKETIFDMQIAEFLDEVNRLQIIVNTDALLGGAYSGMMDTKKIKKSEFNWMRDISANDDRPKGQVINEGTF